jgi:uncharacterized protein YprB with RNaseH-like and TPR domain
VLKLQIMSVHNLQISTENLLGVVLQMPDAEYDKFIEKANKLRRKSVKPAWTKTEIKLIKKISDSVLSAEKQLRFNKLVKKRRAEKITETELTELIDLTEESEKLNAERIRMLAKLATSKKKTLSEIMDELEIYPPKII